jgi:hypothetical protein
VGERRIGAEDGRRTAPVVGGERFGLWAGASGRRHVFSRVDHPIEDGDLDGAVVAIVDRRGTGPERLVWLGRGEDAPRGTEAASGREIHAHWLAETARARAAVIADLIEAAGTSHDAPQGHLAFAA